MARILIVDDEEGIRSVLSQLVEYEDHEVRAAGSGPEGLELYEEFRPDLTFLDVKMPRMDGLEVLTGIREHDPDAVVVMISGHGTIDTALEATRRGAYDFLEKPLDTDRILVLLRNALERRGLSRQNAHLRDEVESRFEIVGRSFTIRQLLERIDRVGPTDARVMISGENGTGKELVARAIHRVSTRADAPFVEVNCAAIPSELIESELFGHMKGAFTGAHEDRAGKFELADGGTLFLDEIGDMSLAAQAKVLRVLQEGVVTRVGGGKSFRVDVRVIAATNKDIRREIEEGGFREDLLHRLNTIPLQVPPLRERREDIPMLVRHFRDRMLEEAGIPPRSFTDEAVELLSTMDWTGNVRELKNAVERLLILAPNDPIDAGDVRMLVQTTPRAAAGVSADLLACETFSEFRDTAERAFILAKLRENDWNVAETARGLDMPRSNLYKKIEKHGLVREEV